MNQRDAEVRKLLDEADTAIAALEGAVAQLRAAAAEDQLESIAVRIGLDVGESKTVAFGGRSWTMTRTQ